MKKILLILFLLLPIISNGQRALYYASKVPAEVPAYDPDAQAFITATGITGTDATAINNLVVSAKTHGWWDACVFIYPFIGGTAATHKFNLKNPVDDDDAFRITFVGGESHSSNGIQWDGTTGYGNTHWTPSDVSDIHLSFWNRDATVNDFLAQPMGASTSSAVDIYFNIFFAVYGIIGNSATPVGGGNVGYTGLFLMSRPDNTSSSFRIYQNDNNITSGDQSNSATTGFNQTLYIGARNDQGTASNFCDMQFTFATGGTSVDASMEADMYSDILAFQTELGR